ncbi:Uncharacterised protein [Vibrio cholerae]|nr:Uncharacterised protein [Vibrio cholerae]CSI29422.1 Uncharacterised protein [Vibrio cholerae]
MRGCRRLENGQSHSVIASNGAVRTDRESSCLPINLQLFIPLLMKPQRWQRIHYCRLFNHLLLHQALT